MMLPKSLRRQEADGPEADLTLGKVVIKDYSNSRVLERRLMYERRIENSLFKTMDELRKRRLMRELEQAQEELSTDMINTHPDKRHRDETAPRQARDRSWPKSATRFTQDAAAKRFVRDELVTTEDRKQNTEGSKRKNGKQTQLSRTECRVHRKASHREDKI